MKKIIIKTGPGRARIEIDIDGKHPNYCNLAVYSPDDDMTMTKVDTSKLLNATAEMLKEIRES